MCRHFFKSTTKLPENYVYWDTNCYRILGRNANQNGLLWLDNFLKKLKKTERKKRIKVKVSYLVLAEMIAHLNDTIDSKSYIESKHGLYAALYHSDFLVSNLLPTADNEFSEFITKQKPIAETLRQDSLYNYLLQFNAVAFNDKIIKENYKVTELTINYLINFRQNWKNSFLDNFIKKHDLNYKGNWQVFAESVSKRSTLLLELRAAKESNLIFKEFGIGMYLYVKNHNPEIEIPDLTDKLLCEIIERFKPIFLLQFRIIELICQSGYNMDKYKNDITDYSIISHLIKGKTIFVSNETKHLIPNLHKHGYELDVLTFESYLVNLKLNNCLTF